MNSIFKYNTSNAVYKISGIFLSLVIIIICGYYIYTSVVYIDRFIINNEEEMTLEEMVNKYTFERQRALIEKQNAESIKSQMYPSREEEIINIPESQILKIQSQIKTNTMTPKQRSEVLSELNIK